MASSKPPSFNAVPDQAAAELSTSAVGDADHALLLEACRQVLLPLATLAVERGVPYAELDELLRGAFVEAARTAHPNVSAQRGASRISAATGLTRREVTRLLQPPVTAELSRSSPATQVFSRWLTDPQLRLADGTVRALPRQGPPVRLDSLAQSVSFESLAQSVTKDVHPRTLLEELLRLGLARLDDASDTVKLLRETFVPTGDEARMFGFLGANVGDHLRGAVANVLAQGPRNVEQALFADGLSSNSVAELRPLVAQQWQAVARSLVPLVQQFIDADVIAGRTADQRLRVGLYMYAAATAATPIQDAADRDASADGIPPSTP
jgi:Family of unknown function (DUF6502)